MPREDFHTGIQGRRIHVTGVVQGVGFRPFIYALAKRHTLGGWVCNTSSGVDIEVSGPVQSLEAFCRDMISQAPPLSRIESWTATRMPPGDDPGFVIRHSVACADQFLPVSADVAICTECRRELQDRSDRRYRYPFINCTQCGPRFTILTDIPYDRPYTTMAPFQMCDDCASEYRDPSSRRFHAQPNACAKCGPQVRLVPAVSLLESGLAGREDMQGEAAIVAARRLLKDGRIVAIKGLGGFHLACSPFAFETVAELRRRKGRIDKPFALMARNLDILSEFCQISSEEQALLVSPQCPIVLLRRRPHPAGEGFAPSLSPWVAPGQTTLGCMLPYTPLHELLLEAEEGFPSLLIMTSGNIREEPIATSNEEARARLSSLADSFLLHNREIHVRCDDSVVRIFEGRELPLRRSRGYAPYPVKLPHLVAPILATGGELKNVFCVTREDYAFLSQHVGDMENYETLVSFERSVTHFENLFRIRPRLIGYDLHPDYLSTRYALERSDREGIPAMGVQHHHAHIASCMAENGLRGDSPVIGVAFDGTGYGVDGSIWGGEFLICSFQSFERFAHLAYVPLPGGDTAIRHPFRIALSYLDQAGIEWSPELPCVAAASELERTAIAHQIRTGLNSPPTSSMGRLFDAVASLLDVRQIVNYEGQAAMELESLCDPREKETYSVPDCSSSSLDCSSIFPEILSDLKKGIPHSTIAAKFHNYLATLVLKILSRIRSERGLDQVALSGGVFQNVTLLGRTLDLLRNAGFLVYTHHLVPPNDGGIALGQAVIASQMQDHES